MEPIESPSRSAGELLEMCAVAPHHLPMTLSVGEWLVFFVAVAGGAAIQNVVGFGLALLVAPIVGVVRPDLMPTMMILMSFPLSTTMAIRGRRDIDWTNLNWSILGRLPTIALGAWIVSIVSTRMLGGLVGALVIVSCVISAMSNVKPITRSRALGAGAFSGFMETTAAVGGAPMALLYQHRPGPEIRSTLAMSFIAGKSIAFVALAVGGEITRDPIVAAVSLFPALFVGTVLAKPLVVRLGTKPLRPAVLVLCAATGLVAVLNALLKG